MTSSKSINTLTEAIVEGIRGRKGSRVTTIDLSAIESTPAAAFIVCEGRSTTQVAAIADNIREFVQEATGRKPYNYDGYSASQWIVIDYGELFVHIFLPEERLRYNLEDLWSDAEITNLPDED